MAKGCDVNASVIGHIHNLKAVGIQWIGRYYGTTKLNPLTKQEVQDITSVDLWTVAIWESGFPTSRDYFTAEQGHLDASHAHHQMSEVGQPDGSALYIPVDYDAATAHLPAIEAYFAAFREKLRPVGYLIGAYGSGLVCKHLAAAGIVEKTWLARPQGWAGYNPDSVYNIYQTHNGVPLCGLLVDLDESDGNAGGFQIE